MSSGVDPSALRAARERLGLTQHQLARMVGVAGGERISRWELGLDEPRPDSWERLARVLNAPVVELHGVDPERLDLRALRYCAGLSAGEVAAAVHISARSYARWESGAWVQPPSTESLRAIARRLNVSVGAVREALELAHQAEQPRKSRRCSGICCAADGAADEPQLVNRSIERMEGVL